MGLNVLAVPVSARIEKPSVSNVLWFVVFVLGLVRYCTMDPEMMIEVFFPSHVRLPPYGHDLFEQHRRSCMEVQISAAYV